MRLAGGANRLPTGTSMYIESGKIFDLNGQNQTINTLTCEWPGPTERRGDIHASVAATCGATASSPGRAG